MPTDSRTKRQCRIQRVERRIIEIYHSGVKEFTAQDISKACNMKSGLSAARIIISILPENIGGIEFRYLAGLGRYQFTTVPPEKTLSKGPAHILEFLSYEWQPVTTIAAFANRTGRRVRTHLHSLEKSGAIESMYDENIGARYWRLKRSAEFHRASEEARA